MTEIKTDIEKMEQFFNELKSFISFVEAINTFINGQLRLLSDKWNDEVYEKFRNEFNNNMKAMLQFSEIANMECKFLEKKILELKEYKK